MGTARKLIASSLALNPRTAASNSVLAHHLGRVTDAANINDVTKGLGRHGPAG
jgi:hypothetical protein